MNDWLPDWNRFLEYTFWNNTMESYLWGLLVFVGAIVFSRLFQRVLLKKLGDLARGTRTTVDDRIVTVFRRFSLLFYWLVALRLASLPLRMDETADRVLDGLVLVLAVIFIVKIVRILVDFGLSAGGSEGDRTARHGMRLIIGVALWGVATVFVLDNLGFDVNMLVTSLGLAGVVAALASQNIFSDLFSSFSLYFDKPFEIDDFIVIGDNAGVVEKIGLRSTRLRLLQGEELVVSNQELTSARVRNFKKMQERRIAFRIGVEFGTPSEKLREVPARIRQIVAGLGDRVRFDRCHFSRFGDFSLLFEIVYYVCSPDYTEYRDIQQTINLEIKAFLESEGIEMALPTQTVLLERKKA